MLCLPSRHTLRFLFFCFARCSSIMLLLCQFQVATLWKFSLPFRVAKSACILPSVFHSRRWCRPSSPATWRTRVSLGWRRWRRRSTRKKYWRNRSAWRDQAAGCEEAHVPRHRVQFPRTLPMWSTRSIAEETLYHRILVHSEPPNVSPLS